MMKKLKLFLSLIFVALAFMVAGGSTFAVYSQAQALRVQPAAATTLKGSYLFDQKGRYMVPLDALQKGTTFQFFGYDWKVVYVNQNQKVATFWMTKPMEDKYAFNTHDGAYMSGDKGLIKDDCSNVWANGYSYSKLPDVWNQEVKLGSSNIRDYLTEVAKTMIDNPDYGSYKNKVVSGYVTGTNLPQERAQRTDINLAISVQSKTSADRAYKDKENKIYHKLTANYALTLDNLSEVDRLWLPAIEEICDKNTQSNIGLWDLTNDDRNWQDVSVDNIAWLRTPSFQDSCFGTVVAANTTIGYGNKEKKSEQSVFDGYYINNAHGVRPAIHLNIETLEQDYLDHLEEFPNDVYNPNKDKDNSDRMMQIFFIVVCCIGIGGIILVTIAVIVKNHKNKQQEIA